MTSTVETLVPSPVALRLTNVFIQDVFGCRFRAVIENNKISHVSVLKYLILAHPLQSFEIAQPISWDNSHLFADFPVNILVNFPMM